VAFLRTTTLRCVDCETTAPVSWVVGTGPGTPPGKGPSYVHLRDAGPWLVEETSRQPFWAGRLICPDCGICVLQEPKPGKE